MKKIAIVIYHQCPTDSIVCFSLPIYYSTMYDSVILLVTEHADVIRDFFKYVYRNINCKIIYINSYKVEETVNNLIKNNTENTYEYFPHGIWYCKQNNFFIQDKCLTNNEEKYLAGSQYFYSNFTKKILDTEICFKYFNVERDLNLELEKYNEIKKSKGDKYFIINGDLSMYDKKKLPNYNYFNLCFSSIIVFDMIKVIENAEEIHLISTFWSLIIYYLQLRYNLFSTIKIYFHSYVRHGRLECLYHEHGTLPNWTFYTCHNPQTCNHAEHSISGIW
jgi:hypothetical protein